MEGFKASAPPEEEVLEVTLPHATKKMVPGKKDQDRLFYMKFQANIHQATKYGAWIRLYKYI